jgi:hypothetical protein
VLWPALLFAGDSSLLRLSEVRWLVEQIALAAAVLVICSEAALCKAGDLST